LEGTLAQIKVYGLQSHLNPVKAHFSEVIHQSLVEAFKLPPDKKFQRFILLEPGDFIFPSDRSEKYTIIEIIMFEGRSVEAKKQLVRLLYTTFAESLGISPRDLEIVMIETPQHNWGIRGVSGDDLKLHYLVRL
jgi:phenylpyruvate tautomerase PptA (4-oxalocrotonate tautomerase family)